MMGSRRMLLAGAATTVVLTAASMTGIAVAQHGGTPATPYGGMMRGAAWATCAGPSQLPGQRVTVVLADMRAGPMTGGRWTMGGSWTTGGRWMMGGRTMMLRPDRATVSAGTMTFVAYNHGTRTHELVVLPLQRGAAVGTRPVGADDTVEETGSLGEASNNCAAGSGAGIAPGAVSWVTVTLRPGRYELVCNLPGHYAAGMYAELDVT